MVEYSLSMCKALGLILSTEGGGGEGKRKKRENTVSGHGSTPYCGANFAKKLNEFVTPFPSGFYFNELLEPLNTIIHTE